MNAKNVISVFTSNRESRHCPYFSLAATTNLDVIFMLYQYPNYWTTVSTYFVSENLVIS